VDSSFILHSILGSDFTNFAVSVSARSGIPKINREELAEYRMRVPIEAEQQAIGQALDAADDLIATLERLIAKKQAIKQGMMQQLFAGRSHAPNRWRECCLGENLLRPPRYGINAAAVPLRPGIATYIRITDINDDGGFDPHPKVGVAHPNAASYILNPGELVLARTGASVGKSYLYDPRDGELVYAGFLINIAPDPRQLNPKFLALFVQTADYWNWVARISMRSGQPGINGREYAQLPIALPSIDIQDTVAETFADVDQQIEVLERRLHKSCAIKIGMMQQLLTGRARLRAEAAS
jgi:type I restriction enzyme S subunit